MRAIKINFSESNDDLFGQSKWWGLPDMPDDLDVPMIPYDDGTDNPMTFLCQIRCSDLAKYDTENLLPHKGMLYFFAAIEEYVGNLTEEFDIDDCPFFNGMGEWAPEAYRVLYSPDEDDLSTIRIVDEDGSPFGLPAEKLTFETMGNPESLDFKLLGLPFETEVGQEYPQYINLLQVWEEDRWGFFMYDCGILSFLITPEDLKARRFDRVIVYLHSC